MATLFTTKESLAFEFDSLGELLDVVTFSDGSMTLVFREKSLLMPKTDAQKIRLR